MGILMSFSLKKLQHLIFFYNCLPLCEISNAPVEGFFFGLYKQ